MKKLKFIVIGLGVVLVGCGENVVELETVEPSQEKTIFKNQLWSKISEKTWHGDVFAGQGYTFFTNNSGERKCLYQVYGSGLPLISSDFVNFEILSDKEVKIGEKIFHLINQKLVSGDYELKLQEHPIIDVRGVSRDISTEELKSDDFKIENLSKFEEKFIDINLDGKPEKIILKKVFENYNNEGFEDFKYFVFDDPDSPQIKTSNCANINDLFEIGDIDEDGDVELGMYYSGCTGRLKHIKVLSLVDNQWKEITSAIISARSMEPDFSERVVKIEKNKFKIYEKYVDMGESGQETLIERYRYFSFDGEETKEMTDVGNGYLKDNEFVYYQDASGFRIIESANAETFEIIDKYNFAKDSENVFYQGWQIDDADAKTFQLINSYYTKDKYNMYWKGNKFEGIDPETFEYVDYNHVKDKNACYANRVKVDGFIEGKSGIFYCGYHIKDADSNTLRILNGYYVRDEDTCYKDGEIVPMSECNKIEQQNK